MLNTVDMCIGENSPMGLKMAEVVQISKLSKGSVYKHSQCEEGMLTTLVAKISRQQISVNTDTLARSISLSERSTAITLMTPAKPQSKAFVVPLFSSPLLAVGLGENV